MQAVFAVAIMLAVGVQQAMLELIESGPTLQNHLQSPESLL